MKVELVKLVSKQLTLQELSDIINYELGSSNPDYFQCTKSGGLKLQQIPSEYANLLFYLKNEVKPETYLELGIGNGGSWLTTSFFLKDTLLLSVAVDNLAYGELIGQNISEIKEVENYIKYNSQVKSEFIHLSTDDFFATETRKFDVIFIDADHSYEGVKKDYNNALNLIKDNGHIIFHDINSKAAQGVTKLWKEIENENCITFVHSNTCGIGIIQIKNNG